MTDGNLNSARLTVTHFTDFKGVTSKFYYNLVCDYDTCNNRNTAEAFALLLRDHHNITAMLDTLRFPERSQTATEPSTRSHSVATTNANVANIRAPTSKRNSTHLLESIKTMVYALQSLLFIHLIYDRWIKPSIFGVFLVRSNRKGEGVVMVMHCSFSLRFSRLSVAQSHWSTKNRLWKEAENTWWRSWANQRW